MLYFVANNGNVKLL